MHFSPWYMISRVLALAVALALAAVAQAAPRPAVLELARSMQPAVIEQLGELVQIESGSRQPEGLARMADVLEARLQALGMAVERHRAGAGADGYILVATIHGNGSARIMLQGHMDTGYGPGILDAQPYRVDGDRIQGPGSADDKGGLALMLGALHMARASNWNDFDTITVLVNPDHELGSPGSGDLITDLASQHDVVLSFERGATGAEASSDSLLLGAPGSGQVRLTVSDKTPHAAGAPEGAGNALYELAHQIMSTRDVARQVDGASLQWTVAHTGGNLPSRVPASAHAVADVRVTRPGAEQALVAALGSQVRDDRAVPGTEASVALDMLRPMFRASDASRALAERAQAIYGELDRELALLPMAQASTDAAFAAQSGQAAVVAGLGLPGADRGAGEEYVDAGAIVPRLYLVMRLLQDIGANG